MTMHKCSVLLRDWRLRRWCWWWLLFSVCLPSFRVSCGGQTWLRLEKAMEQGTPEAVHTLSRTHGHNHTHGGAAEMRKQKRRKGREGKTQGDWKERREREGLQTQHSSELIGSDRLLISQLAAYTHAQTRAEKWTLTQERPILTCTFTCNFLWRHFHALINR